MITPDYFSPVFARKVLDEERTKAQRQDKKAERAFKRCRTLIEACGDYHFLIDMGYNKASLDCFLFVEEKMRWMYTFNAMFLIPLFRFLRHVPTMVFYRKDPPIASSIITNEELFNILLSVDSDTLDRSLQVLAVDADSLASLGNAIANHDVDHFISIIKGNNIDTTHLGQFLNLNVQLGQKIASRSDLLNAFSLLQEALSGTFPYLPPSNIPFYYDDRHYLTKKNCIASFIYATDATTYYFDWMSALAFALYHEQDSLPFQLRDALNVFFSDEYFPELLKFLKHLGYPLDGTAQKSENGEQPPETNHQVLHPLVRPPEAFSDEIFGESLCRSFFKRVAKCSGHWLRPEDEDLFLFLFNVSKERPLYLRPLVWDGHKYELKCMLEVLYPNRKRRERPDYRDMDHLFRRSNGQRFDLPSTPLQCKKKVIDNPDQARKEERLMAKYTRFTEKK